jgi:PAS domain S-box-containing protein
VGSTGADMIEPERNSADIAEMNAGKEPVGSTRPPDRLWLYSIGAGLVFGAALFVIPHGGWVWILVATPMLVASPILVAVALVRHRPAAKRGWYWVFVGLALNAAATLIWYPSQVGWTSLPYPSIADALFLAGYVPILIGVSSLVYPRSGGERRTGVLDALIVAIGAGIVSWGFLIGPILDQATGSGQAKAVSVAYPMLDLMMLAVATRLAFAGRRTPARKLLGCYLLVQFAADSIFAYTILKGTFSAASPVFALWAVAQGSIAAAALHPSMRSLATPPSTARSTLSKRRAWAIALAAIGGPAAIIAWPTLDDARILSVVALGLFCLVIVRLSSLTVDVDRYRRIQQDLRTAETKYRALVEHAPITVYEWEFGEPGRWRYVSPRIHDLLGYEASEYMADPDLWSGQIHEDDRDIVLASESMSQAAGPAVTVEYRMRHRDGRVVWVHDDAIVVQDEGGRPYFRGILADITLQKKAEQELESVNVDLERRVTARTEELLTANVELAGAKDEAERASAAKSEFLSRASHELRTPLNAILGFGQLLEMSSLSDRDNERLAHILKGGRHLLRLINEVLDVSKVQAGSLSLSLEPVSVDDVVGQAVAAVRAGADNRQIALKARSTSNDFVLADRQRLLQILSELLSNGMQFNEPGGVVAIDWSSDEARTSIRVTDTGKGIAAEDLPGVFALFDRGVSRSPGGQEGTGLGLALCKGLVEAMGGSIRVESELGAGTTVSLELLSSTAPVFDGPATDPLLAGSGHTKRDLTILCVEDNPANLALIQEIVGSRPRIRMLRASGGAVGLELARDHNPDLVLLDLHLPDMSGEEALSHLKSDPATRHIPVIVVSADTDMSRIRRLEKMGSDGFISKPIDILHLLTLIDATLTTQAPSGVP